MNAALLALISAVLTLLAYLLLTDQLDYATVRRRQIDAWAAMTGLVCLVGIAYGGLDARRAALGFADLDASAPRVPVEVKRIGHPELTTPSSARLGVGDGPASPAQVGSSLGEPEPDPVELLDRDVDADAGAPPASDLPRVGLAEPRSDPDPAPIAQPLGAAVQDAVESVIAAPAPSVQRVVTRAPLEPVRPAPTIELLLPSVTPAPPAQPTEPPAPTPYCGDPEAIRMTLRIEDARVDRESDPQAVRYRARITNEAGFPVGVRNLLVTAQDSRSGADQFGSDRRPDLQIEGGHAVAIDGSVKLEKYPSPFGRSELCVSFVTDACGRQAPFPITRRCFSISGF